MTSFFMWREELSEIAPEVYKQVMKDCWILVGLLVIVTVMAVAAIITFSYDRKKEARHEKAIDLIGEEVFVKCVGGEKLAGFTGTVSRVLYDEDAYATVFININCPHINKAVSISYDRYGKDFYLKF